MALPEFTLRQLLEAGVHFGHQTHRWNPRMAPYIYGDRNGIHIIDLTQTVPLLDHALHAVHDTVSRGGRILFVGTKRQAQKAISDAAERSAQYYMNHRWLGGTLTNWKTVSQSIARLKSIDEKLEGGAEGLTKKERLGLAGETSPGVHRLGEGPLPAAAKPEKEDREPWLCPNSICANSWKPASTSAIRLTAGTRAWGRTSTATATAFTSST
jgi:ribosomal protein S2